ncbi:MAG: lipoate--protein ligase family protein [Clostridia bacterium]|nr:lipoate--protein ligase family protein [Clostridia bacterium]
MGVDEAVLDAVAAGATPPTLRLYGWRLPTLSLGCFQPLARHVDLTACRASGVAVVRRPTGGRAVLHDGDLTYSVVLPAGLLPAGVQASYRVVSGGLVAGLRRLGADVDWASGRVRRQGGSPACFEAAVTGEVEAGGRKLVGSAQVRRPGAVLQHGSIPLDFDAARVTALLRHPGRDLAVVTASLAASATGLRQVLGRAVTFREVAQAVASGFAEHFGVELEPGGLSAVERRRAEELATSKYAQAWWTARR